MRKSNVFGRISAFILVLILVFNGMPLTALAGDGDKTGNYGSFIDGAQVINTIISNYGENKHPRIIMTEEKFAKLRTYVKDGQVVNDGSVTAALLIELKGEADNYYSAGIPPYEVDSEGHILEYSKRIQRYVATLALSYNIFGDEKYAERCYEVMESACKSADEFGAWDPHHFLDTAEMCTGLAYGYDWIYNYMDENQRKLIRDAIIEKGFNQVMNDYEKKVKFNRDATKLTDRSYVWYDSKKGDNWMFVCTGGMNLAALAIGDEADAKDIAAQVLDYGYKKAYTAVRQGYDTTDGTYVEGLGYWDYATYYLGLQSSALISATGTDYGLTDHEGLRKSVDFVRYMSSNYPYSFSFGDDNDSRDTGWPVFLWLGEHYNSPEMATIRLRKISEDPEFRYLDVLWIDESKQTDSVYTNSTDWGAVGAKNASFRNTWDISGLVAALHTGENDLLYHGHFDLGSFYIESNGARFFTDLGNEDYYLKDREYSYRIKPEGHNTLVINPTSGTDQRDKVTCTITDYNSGNEAYAVTDLTEAYGDNGAQSVIRGLKMIKDKECVIIQDEISLNKAGEIYWFAHTKGNISVAADGKSAIVTVGSDRMWVGLLSDGGKLTAMDPIPLSTSKNVPNATSNNGYTKLAIHLTNTKDATISVACIPLKNGESVPSWIPQVESISGWSSTVEDDVTQHTHTGIKVEKKEATCTEAGAKEYYKCECGECFEDAECTKKIEDIDTWVKVDPLGHDLTEVNCIDSSHCQRIGCDYVDQVALGHDFSGEYDGYDDDSHWHICQRQGCDAIDTKEAHYGGMASVDGPALCAACGQPYGSMLGVPEVTAPVYSNTVVYDPGKTLSDYPLAGSNGTCGGVEVTGTWSWLNASEVPLVSVSEYTAVFTPDDLTKYVSVETTVTLNVSKAKTEFTSVPTAGGITYGQKISEANITEVKVTSGTKEVPGKVVWEANDAELRPTVSEAQLNTYTVEFRPDDSVNYESLSVEVKVAVAKADSAPNMPADTMNPSFDISKVSENTLPDNWKWSDDDKNSNLEPGISMVATANYIGKDAGNYSTETVQITITRSTCEHSKELRNEKASTCSEEGYTGDYYCTICDELIVSGNSIPKLSHSGGTANCVHGKICTVCGEEYGERDYNNHPETEIRGKITASCDVDGYSGDKYCTVCNQLIEQGSIDKKATGHTYRIEVTTEPTYFSEGVRTYTCEVCGNTHTETIAKLPVDVPFCKEEKNVIGWDAIAKYIADEAIDSKENIVIDMNGSYIVPVSVLESLVDKDIDVIFEASDNISWTVHAKYITKDNIKDTDIRYATDIDVEKVEDVEDVEGIEDVKDIENVKDIEDDKDIEDVKDIEDLEDIKDVNDIENGEMVIPAPNDAPIIEAPEQSVTPAQKPKPQPQKSETSQPKQKNPKKPVDTEVTKVEVAKSEVSQAEASQQLAEAQQPVQSVESQQPVNQVKNPIKPASQVEDKQSTASDAVNNQPAPAIKNPKKSTPAQAEQSNTDKPVTADISADKTKKADAKIQAEVADSVNAIENVNISDNPVPTDNALVVNKTSEDTNSWIWYALGATVCSVAIGVVVFRNKRRY